jgi:hypothetical protein
MAERGAPVESQIQYAFERCMSRSPSAAEISALQRFHADQLTALKTAPETVAKITGQTDSKPELAAAIALARVILNLDEFITRE